MKRRALPHLFQHMFNRNKGTHEQKARKRKRSETELLWKQSKHYLNQANIDRPHSLMLHLHHRSENPNANRTSTTTTPLHRIMKKLELRMKDFNLSGQYGTIMLDFLSVLAKETQRSRKTIEKLC